MFIFLPGAWEICFFFVLCESFFKIFMFVVTNKSFNNKTMPRTFVSQKCVSPIKPETGYRRPFKYFIFSVNNYQFFSPIKLILYKYLINQKSQKINLFTDQVLSCFKFKFSAVNIDFSTFSNI